MLAAPPVLMTSEADPDRPEAWRLDAYFEDEPSTEDLALLHSLVPSAHDAAPSVERLADADWVSLSQQGLEPIRAGRFFVHTPAHRGQAADGDIAFEIDAGQAFGTGHHETTTGCLLTLDRLRRQGAAFANILDMGTGTGLLAFAALALWRTARVAASDIDPIAIDVSRDNAAINRIPPGRARSQVEFVVASGLDHARLKARAPYDLIIANILAGPLITMAPSVAAALEPGGRLILAGLLTRQAEEVARAYRRHGLMLTARTTLGEWPTLVMRKRRMTARKPRR